MKNEEIVQVLEMHLDRVRDLYRHYRERNGASEETAARMEEAAREAEALACAVHIVGLYADDGIPLERLGNMGGEPVFIVSKDEDPHWELSADGADYLEGRDPLQYGTKWAAYAHPFRTPQLDARDRDTLCAALRDLLEERMGEKADEPVQNQLPVLRYRPKRYERYEESGLNENGEVLYLKRVYVDEKSYAIYCPACGRRLCSRFTSYCPNCGTKMAGEP